MSEFSLSPLISLSECPNNAHHKEHISTIYNVRLASKYSMWKPCHDSLCGLSEPSQCQDRWGLGGKGRGFTPTCQNTRMGGMLGIHTYLSECKDGWGLRIHTYMSECKDGWGADDSHLHVRMQGWVGGGLRIYTYLSECKDGWGAGDSHLHVRMQGWVGCWGDSHLHVRMQGWMGAGDSHLHVRMQWWVGCWEFTLTCQNARMDGGGWWFSPTCQNARMGKVLGIHMYMSGWGLGIHT